jgi:hypothetical protein
MGSASCWSMYLVWYLFGNLQWNEKVIIYLLIVFYLIYHQAESWCWSKNWRIVIMNPKVVCYSFAYRFIPLKETDPWLHAFEIATDCM